ncbi:unnamed protein product [Brugia timori]|uniref:Uncharacterized protein n=1 Tax=Brugia timori TaxID=42155 RepID=A0A0R3QJJ4_9BILA|nr:unnamed protein product [Brugia timori]
MIPFSMAPSLFNTHLFSLVVYIVCVCIKNNYVWCNKLVLPSTKVDFVMLKVLI